MGKNKGQKAKTKKEKAFTVINTKKTKTKTVAKNLKKVSLQVTGGLFPCSGGPFSSELGTRFQITYIYS